jgi:hypothetical protein
LYFLKIAEKYQQVLVFAGLAFILSGVAILAPGTCDSGDSITHYLFARYAFAHPENFLDHWAKPVFTLLAAPFAQIGFTGIKMFNVLVALCTSFFTFRMARLLDIKKPLLAPLFLFAFPLYTITVFSGLTEPLFSLVLAAGIYALLAGHQATGAVVLSFLPFCRSEGLIVLGVAAVYLLLRKRPAYLPFLLAGHAALMVAGWAHYHDLFWVFDRIPYLGQSTYGRGGWTHFFVHGPDMFGVPLLVLLVAGLGWNGIALFSRSGRRSLFSDETVLVTGVFLAVFSAHVIFWKFGLFHSFGLIRVMAGVMPLAALIALRGLGALSGWISMRSTTASRVISGLVLGYVFIFPFAPNPSAFNFRKDFGKKDDQVVLDEAAALIRREFPGAKVYSSHYYAAAALDVDPFNKKAYEGLWFFRKGEDVPPGSVIIWDSWFARQENGLNENDLASDPRFTKTAEYEKEGSKISLFIRNPAP